MSYVTVAVSVLLSLFAVPAVKLSKNLVIFWWAHLSWSISCFFLAENVIKFVAIMSQLNFLDKIFPVNSFERNLVSVKLSGWNYVPDNFSGKFAMSQSGKRWKLVSQWKFLRAPFQSKDYTWMKKESVRHVLRMRKWRSCIIRCPPYQPIRKPTPKYLTHIIW